MYSLDASALAPTSTAMLSKLFAKSIARLVDILNPSPTPKARCSNISNIATKDFVTSCALVNELIVASKPFKSLMAATLFNILSTSFLNFLTLS